MSKVPVRFGSTGMVQASSSLYTPRKLGLAMHPSLSTLPSPSATDQDTGDDVDVERLSFQRQSCQPALFWSPSDVQKDRAAGCDAMQEFRRRGDRHLVHDQQIEAPLDLEERDFA